MVQGTGSHVGKTTLVGALCRLYSDRGYRVAPFKVQNMSLNSYVVAGGGEISRAQAWQAQAARAEPVVEMNPILLKPTGAGRVQVIVRGKAVDTMTTAEYHAFLPRAWEAAREAYRTLAAAHDLIVIEGAGSPAEVNLRDRDIANMRAAELADAPVLLVGDIERGGVFAALVGTLDLLPPRERARITGLVINKFRGDRALLAPGLDFLERRTGLPVLGVLPYYDAALPDQEDSLGIPSPPPSPRGGEGAIRIVVVRLPHLSNFSDFDPLRSEPGVAVRFEERPEALEEADVAILPGTKQTVGDLEFLRASGWVAALERHRERGGFVVGICGGYQMLGARIYDPDGIESERAEAEGLGWLPVVARFGREKVTSRVCVRAIVEPKASNIVEPKASSIGEDVPAVFSAYQIHHGRVERLDGRPGLFALLDPNGDPLGVEDGASDATGRVWGTSLHGLFENNRFRKEWLDDVRSARRRRPGSEDLPASASAGRGLSFAGLREQAIDGVARLVAEHLDLKKIDERILLSH